MIEVVGVTKVYGKGKNSARVLNNVSLKIESGATVAIVGKSGSGKSTLMHLISGLEKVTNGKVIVDNKDLSSLKKKQVDKFRSSKIGFVFQSFFVEGSQDCFQNVALPLEISKIKSSHRKSRVEAALKQVDLSEKIGSKAKNLSGGQKQRLAIARAIVNRPKYIFADEPTGNLDSVNGQKVENLLFDLNRTLGSTLIIVTHDPDLAAKCQTVILLKDGQVVDIKHRTAKVGKV